ncbi:34245_t:CDS:2, partial [Racocetra persica]
SSQRDLAVKKFGELTSAYTRLKQENNTLHEEIKKQLEDINKKLNTDTLATNLADKLKPLISEDINYETVKENIKKQKHKKNYIIKLRMKKKEHDNYKRDLRKSEEEKRKINLEIQKN